MINSGSDIQIEGGRWARIHVRILELLALANFNASEYRCLIFLFRRTYGEWDKRTGNSKKVVQLSLREWQEGTGIKRQNVWVTLQGLEAKRVIISVDTGPRRPKLYQFNKYFEEWDSDLLPAYVDRRHDSSGGSVMSEHDSSPSTVMPEHDSGQSVMPTHDSLDPICNARALQSVMPTHDRSRVPIDIDTTTIDGGGGSGGEKKTDSAFSAICKKYENNIGSLTESIGEQLQAALEEHPADWILEAIDIATGAEKRSLRYVNGILRRWHREGRGAGPPPSARNGKLDVDLGDI